MSKETKDEVITFRLSKTEFAPYKKILAKRDLKKSRLFREIAIAKAEDIVLPKETSADKKRMLFVASKASNNINQIAKKLNSAYHGDIISGAVYAEVLNNLISIERAFAGALKKC